MRSGPSRKDGGSCLGKLSVVDLIYHKMRLSLDHRWILASPVVPTDLVFGPRWPVIGDQNRHPGEGDRNSDYCHSNPWVRPDTVGNCSEYERRDPEGHDEQVLAYTRFVLLLDRTLRLGDQCGVARRTAIGRPGEPLSSRHSSTVSLPGVSCI